MDELEKHDCPNGQASSFTQLAAEVCFLSWQGWFRSGSGGAGTVLLGFSLGMGLCFSLGNKAQNPVIQSPKPLWRAERKGIDNETTEQAALRPCSAAELPTAPVSDSRRTLLTDDIHYRVTSGVWLGIIELGALVASANQ